MTRLIDADALKKVLIEEYEAREHYSGEIMLKVIDNAPTVIPDNDIFEWCTDCKEYDQEKHCCHRWSSKIRETAEEIKQCKLEELRPQGRWISDYRTCKCSVCNFTTVIDTYNFCPNCGADMRGKEE